MLKKKNGRIIFFIYFNIKNFYLDVDSYKDNFKYINKVDKINSMVRLGR